MSLFSGGDTDSVFSAFLFVNKSRISILPDNNLLSCQMFVPSPFTTDGDSPPPSDNPDDPNHAWYYDANDDVPMGAPINAPSEPTQVSGEYLDALSVGNAW